MPNFIDCWGQLKAKDYKHADGSEVLNEQDKASMLARIQDHLKTGIEPLEAAKLSVQSHLDEAHVQLQSVYDQVQAKQTESVEGLETKPETQPETPPVAQIESPQVAAVDKEPFSITSIKNEQVDRERAGRGLPSVVESGRKSFGQTWDRATAKIDQNPNYPDELLDELRKKPRALTDEEDVT